MESGVENFAKGCVIGAWVGDALGAVLEFRPISPEGVQRALQMLGGGAHKVGPGQITDDSELSICLLRGLSDANGVMDLDRIARNYQQWVKSPPFDIGLTTRKTLGKGMSVLCHRAAAKTNASGQSNGGMMRIMPLAVWWRSLTPEEVTRATAAETSMSHSNPSAINATVVYNQVIWHLLNHPRDSAAAIEHGRSFAKGEVAEWLADPQPTNPKNSPGWLRHGLTWAISALAAEMPYSAAMQQILEAGGDTDTNAWIVGGVMGAYWGLDNIEPTWVEKVLSYTSKKGGPKRPKWLFAKNSLEHLEKIIANPPASLTIKPAIN